MANLDNQQAERIFAKIGTPRTVVPGEILFSQGDQADHIYYLARGQVRSYVIYDNGDENTLCIVGDNLLLGEDAVRSGAIRVVNIQAMTRCRIYTVTQDAFYQALTDETQSRIILPLLVNKQSVLSDQIYALQFLNNRQRLAYFLWTQSGFGKNRIRLSQEKIADMIGISRATVARLIRDFKAAQYISSSVKSIEIVEAQALCKEFHDNSYPRADRTISANCATVSP